MGKKTDLFGEFFEKNFNSPSTVKIERPIGGRRMTSLEERKQAVLNESKHELAEGEGSAASRKSEIVAAADEPIQNDRAVAFVEEKAVENAPQTNKNVHVSSAEPEVIEVSVQQKRRAGRPKSLRGPVMNVNFLLEIETKQKLERLKVEQKRSSVTDLFKEALDDLFVKYSVE